MELPQSSIRTIEHDSTIPVLSQNLLSQSLLQEGEKRTAHKSKPRAAAALTGCISKLSALELHKHAYFDALRDYAKIYETTQSYLIDDNLIVAHDYVAIINASIESDHGLLGDDGESAAFVQISDDEIDSCGYLGWLRH